MSRQFGRPDHRPAVSAEFLAEILGGGLCRPAVPPAESAGRTAAEFFGRGPPPSLTAVSFDEPPPFFGGARVAYPKVWFLTCNPL